jgi:hypothetical protein
MERIVQLIYKSTNFGMQLPFPQLIFGALASKIAKI